MNLTRDDQRVRQQIRDNDSTLKRLEICHWMALFEEDAIDDFVDAIQCGGTKKNNNNACSSIETLYVTPKSAELLQPATIIRIVQAAGCHFPNLRCIEISTPPINRISQALTASLVIPNLLTSCPQLETLVIWPMCKIESMDVVHQIASSLRGHPSLQTLSLPSMLFRHKDETEETQRMVIDPILEALGTVPNLRNVHFSPCYRIDKQKCLIARPEVVSSLLQSSSHRHFESLALRNMGLNDDFGTLMAATLQCSERTTTTTIAATTLKHMDWRFNDFTEITYRAFRDVLASLQNTTLTSLSLVGSDAIDHDIEISIIDLCLRLNRAGRHVLVKRGGPMMDCWDDFCASCNDTDVMFLLLKASPQIFFPSSSGIDNKCL